MAIREINLMIDCRQQPLKPDEVDSHVRDEFIRQKQSCTIFLGFTSNLVSSGLRETLRFLVEHQMVDCVIMTAGGVEEDFIKCLAPTYMGSFELSGRDLRDRGINRR